MSTHAAAPAEPMEARLRRALQHVTDPPVELRETHLSWVFLTPDRAYKLRKPVHHAFVDQRTLEQRRRLSEIEARINEALAPGLVLGLRAVVPLNTSFVLAPPHTPGAVDWVVEMRRFDEDATLAARVARGAVAEPDLRALGARLARFHAEAEAVSIPAAAARTQAMIDRNAEELLPLVRGVAAAADVAALQRFATAFIAGHGAELDARAARGLVVDGHGDLRAEHVVFEDGDVMVVDRLEFDRALRTLDVADDLAFLVMDLLSLGAPDAANVLVDAYRAAGGDPGGDELVAFHAAYRALVRAKVDLLRARELTGQARETVVAKARAHLELAARLSWRGRGPMVLVVSGPPGSGKSTLAAALSAASGLPVVSADRVRKRLLGLDDTQAAPAEAYTDAARADVYRRLAEGAAELLPGGGVIVDATFADAAHQDAFLAHLPADARDALRVVRCTADPQVLAERVAARTAESAAGSDAGPEVAARLAAQMTSFAVAPAQRLVVETDEAQDAMVARVAAWLDGLIARG